MGNDNILIVVVLAVIAYFILTAEKAGKSALGASLFGATAVTPAGTITSTGATGAVKEISKGSCLGYIFNPVLFATCIAGKTTTLVQSPQTPAPKPDPATDYCPYDVNILAGDSRCVPERVYNYVPKIPTCPEGTYPTWYGGCEAGGGHL